MFMGHWFASITLGTSSVPPASSSSTLAAGFSASRRATTEPDEPDPQTIKSYCGFKSEIRNGSDAARFSDHHFRISSIHGYSGYHGVLTIHNVSASARFARPVFAAEEADADPLTDFPSGHSAA
jgi:hypothetical protein